MARGTDADAADANHDLSPVLLCVRVRIALWLGRWPSARAPSSAANRMDM